MYPRPIRSLTSVTLTLTFALFVGAAGNAVADSAVELGVPGVRGGVVTTSEPIAAQVGAEILRQGGNAIDAMVAVQTVLGLVEPQSSGIGGGGFMVIYLADERRTVIVDSREEAPAAATPDMFVSQASFSVRSTSGYAVGVPGTLSGVVTALEHHANIVPWQQVCEEKGAALRVIPVNDRGELEPGAFEELLSSRTKLLAITRGTLPSVKPGGSSGWMPIRTPASSATGATARMK